MRAGRPRPLAMQPPGTLRCPRIEPCFLEVVYGPIESQPILRAAYFVRCGKLAGALDLYFAGRLGAVADFPFVQLVRLPNYAVRHSGSVETEGDAIALANQVRSQLGVDGTDVRVGVISDGIRGVFATNCSTCGPATSSPINTGD